MKDFFGVTIFTINNSSVLLIKVISGYVLIVTVHMSRFVTARWTLIHGRSETKYSTRSLLLLLGGKNRNVQCILLFYNRKSQKWKR